MNKLAATKPSRTKRTQPLGPASVTAAQDVLVTIVVAFRERWRFTPRTVESILANTGGSFAIWLLDPGMPAAVREQLEPYIADGRLELVPVGEGDQPQHWRAEIAPRLTSPYAVFIDNDVVVMPGWLDRMVDCAEATGAGIVCPLYLWGEKDESDLIHMAGGNLTLEPAGGKTRLTESHRHVGQRIDEVPQDLIRRPCGFGEYHCLMMRREVYSADGMFDPDILTIHEHIHATMLATELGFETWFEPEARVNYLAFAPWQVGELPALRTRWDYDTAERSLDGLARRWNLLDEDDYRSGTRMFLATHAGHTDLLDPRPAAGTRRSRQMARADLEHSYSGLQWLAGQSRYNKLDIDLLLRGYRMALALTEGIYRPDGRPFINHLTGTASVLLFYGAPVSHVAAALLHAAYTHGPPAKAKAWLGIYRAGNANAETATRLVDLYGERDAILDAVDLDGDGLARLSLDAANLMLIEAANQIEMVLSLEVATCGRSDLMPEKRMNNCIALLDHVGLPGIAKTLKATRDHPPEPQTPFQNGVHISFEIPKAMKARPN